MRWVLLLGVVIIALCFWNSREKPPVATSEQIEQVERIERNARLPSLKKNTIGSAKLGAAEKYSFDSIKALVSANQVGMVSCLLRNQLFDAGSVELHLVWEGSGSLNKVEFTPNPGAAVGKCIEDLVKLWHVSPHPSLSPFAYRTVISLGSG